LPDCVVFYYTINSGKNGAYSSQPGFHLNAQYVYVCRDITASYDFTNNNARTSLNAYAVRVGVNSLLLRIQQNYTEDSNGGRTISRQSFFSAVLLETRIDISTTAVAAYNLFSSPSSPDTTQYFYQVSVGRIDLQRTSGSAVVCGDAYRIGASATKDATGKCMPVTLKSDGVVYGLQYEADINITAITDIEGNDILSGPLGNLQPTSLLVRQ